MDQAADIVDLIGSLKLTGAPFAVATVVRIRADGTIEAGWIGGGCARAAVLKAARDAIGDGKPRLISVQPLDVLQAQGVAPGDDRNGIQFARNACPSLGTMDVFVEPILPRPELLIFGASPDSSVISSASPHRGRRSRHSRRWTRVLPLTRSTDWHKPSATSSLRLRAAATK